MIDFIFRKKYSVAIVLLILASISLLIGLLKLNTDTAKPGTFETSVEQTNWIKYTNKDFNFSISFPADWKVHEDFSDVNSPKINIYKTVYKIKLPLDNFSTENHVSIFPKGIPTDAVMGETQIVNFNLAEKTDKTFDYILENNVSWASSISFVEPPKKWEKWGFIWLNNEIKNLKYKCFNGTKEIALDTCNTFEGDIIKRSGAIDKEVRNIEIKILNTFKFID